MRTAAMLAATGREDTSQSTAPRRAPAMVEKEAATTDFEQDWRFVGNGLCMRTTAKGYGLDLVRSHSFEPKTQS
jgi:hypothetical protein